MSTTKGSLDRIKLVSEAIESVRSRAKRAYAKDQAQEYYELMLDLSSLEMVLADETKLYLKYNQSA